MTLIDRANRSTRRVPVVAVYVLGLIPIPYLFWLGLTGRLGVEPIEVLEHRYGLLGLQAMLLGLAITPLRRIVGINLIRFRRAVGLVAFAYIAAHLLVWLILDVQQLGAVWDDIVKRPYVTVGMAGFLCLVPLALTSNDWSVRTLGVRWRVLHKLTYLAVVLGGVHFVMLRKGFQVEPLLYLGIAVVLLAVRPGPLKRRAGKLVA